jgi:hypothetical protein
LQRTHRDIRWMSRKHLLPAQHFNSLRWVHLMLAPAERTLTASPARSAARSNRHSARYAKGVSAESATSVLACFLTSCCRHLILFPVWRKLQLLSAARVPQRSALSATRTMPWWRPQRRLDRPRIAWTWVVCVKAARKTSALSVALLCGVISASGTVATAKPAVRIWLSQSGLIAVIIAEWLHVTSAMKYTGATGRRYRRVARGSFARTAYRKSSLVSMPLAIVI